MPIRATILLFVIFSLAGCAKPASGRFEVSGIAPAYAACFDIAFPFVPIFHASRERDESVGLFFQSRGGNFQFVDVVYFEVFDFASVPLGTPIPTSPLVTDDTRIAAGMALGHSCPPIGILGSTPAGTPSIAEYPVITGDVTFDQFSQEPGDTIAGSIDGALVDWDGNSVAETFTGEFSFEVQVGQPYEEFRN